MERCFSVEAKGFSFLAKVDASKLCLKERRKGFYGFIFLGLQCSAWLMVTIEEALKDLVKKDFVSSGLLQRSNKEEDRDAVRDSYQSVFDCVGERR
jgi:hypothetical protein